MKNLIIFNPLISLNIETRELIFDPDIESFMEGMRYLEQNLEKIKNVFLFADSPPHISSYPELFKSKSDLKIKRGVENLRLLSQFRNEIEKKYKPFIPNHMSTDKINVILKSSCYSKLSKMDSSELSSLPKCRASNTALFSCASIAAMACKIARRPKR